MTNARTCGQESGSGFPRAIFNRAGLDRVDYRIGSYASIRQHLLEVLNGSRVLSGWTHRGADDPGIALLEGQALVADILTFYQSLYANQVFLRTADWRESIAELVQLTGYRLAPGLGGEATFALLVKGDSPVIVPQGFGFKAQLEERAQADEFESTAALIAHPHLGQFHLYRPRFVPRLGPGSSRFFISGEPGQAGAEFRPNDRLMVGQPAPSARDPQRLNAAEVVIVDEAWESFGHTYVQIKGSLAKAASTSALHGYRLGRTFRHFGHTAPAHWVDASSSVPRTRATLFKRDLEGVSGDGVDPPLQATQFLLDGEVSDLPVGSTILIQATLETATQSKGTKNKTAASSQSKFERTFIRKIVAVTQATYTWGPLSAGVTRVDVDAPLPTQIPPPHGVTRVSQVDIRSIAIHEVTAKPVLLRAAHQTTAAESGHELYLFGTADQQQALDGRPLLLLGPDGSKTSVNVTSITKLAAVRDDLPAMRRVDLSRTLRYAEFDLDTPQTTVYGNLIHATQGKTHSTAVLGHGDARQAFQTFALPKPPLTYLLDEGRTPAQTPQLAIHVAGVRWRQVDSFFASGPEDQVYVVREDQDGVSYVQFGDGKSGARLPSGRNNVVATYRTGIGATGRLEPGAKPQATGKLKELDKVFLPGEVVGGDEPESMDNAREAAPALMQSLGRLVGLADFEAEALALPGVLRARAAWAAPDGWPLVRIVVLTAAGTQAALQKVEQSLRTAQRLRGAARHPLRVVAGGLQYVGLSIRAGYAAQRVPHDIAAAIEQALGLDDGGGSSGSRGVRGLFCWKYRGFGQDVHHSQILAAVQQVDGVTWAEIDEASAIDLVDPPRLDAPQLLSRTARSLQKSIPCVATRILALHRRHFQLSLVADRDRREET